MPAGLAGALGAAGGFEGVAAGESVDTEPAAGAPGVAAAGVVTTTGAAGGFSEGTWGVPDTGPLLTAADVEPAATGGFRNVGCMHRQHTSEPGGVSC